MSTKMMLVFIAVSLIALSMVADPVDAAYCGSRRGYCRDGTRGTPCCGYGRCNVFCRNCNGGCREGRTDVSDDGMDSLETTLAATSNHTEGSGFSNENMEPIALPEADEVLMEHNDETVKV